MGKEKPGFMTPKAIANRIKAKGLQKLRWYCQMCEKQCRDENGFKCHTMSESHQRQLLLFADNSRRYLDEFSGDFKSGYLQCLRRRFGTKRVSANTVYQEYISDRSHIHMNATKWYTLTNFVQYLGREGICIVDQTEKGWFLTYIDRDPETIRRQLEIEKKNKLELDDREKQLVFIEKQIEKAKEKDREIKAQYTELKKTDEAIKISFKKVKTDDEKPVFKVEDDKEHIVEFKSVESEQTEEIPDVPLFTGFKEPRKPEKPSSSITSASTSCIDNNPSSSTSKSSSKRSSSSESHGEKRKLSKLDEMILEKEKERERQNRKDYWLHKNIIVKIITNKLGDKYLNKKGIVMAVKDVYLAIIKLTDSDTILKCDQSHLETVLPAIGKNILMVNGAYRGLEAILDGIDSETFTARVVIASGPLNGRVVNNVQYEDICKLYIEEST